MAPDLPDSAVPQPIIPLRNLWSDSAEVDPETYPQTVLESCLVGVQHVLSHGMHLETEQSDSILKLPLGLSVHLVPAVLDLCSAMHTAPAAPDLLDLASAMHRAPVAPDLPDLA